MFIKKTQKNESRAAEKGNVLFLILIAVALFAALSYAVTQSTRGGGGSASRETDLISSAQITQYPATLKTGIIRMLIGGQAYTDLEFNLPDDYDNCTGGTATPATHKNCVFHPDGGGSTYSAAPGSLMVDTQPGDWYFHLNAEIADVGTSDAAAFAGNDLIAFLPGITLALCQRINEALAITGDTTITGLTVGDYEDNMVGDENGGPTYALPSAAAFVIGDADSTGLAGQPFGCFTDDTNSQYVYYHVLVEQ